MREDRREAIASELMDVILKRRSVRKYTADQIPDDRMDQILQAGLLAPTSRNLKPCTFVVIRDRDTLMKLAGAKNAGASMLKDCAAAIAVLGDSSLSDTWSEDCSIALSFMMLMAESLGIGSCWVQICFRKDAEGLDAEQRVREILQMPEQFRIPGILSLGIPAGETKPHTPEEADWDKVRRI